MGEGGGDEEVGEGEGEGELAGAAFCWKAFKTETFFS